MSNNKKIKLKKYLEFIVKIKNHILKILKNTKKNINFFQILYFHFIDIFNLNLQYFLHVFF